MIEGVSNHSLVSLANFLFNNYHSCTPRLIYNNVLGFNLKFSFSVKTKILREPSTSGRFDDSRILSLNLHKWLIKEVLGLGNRNSKISEEFLKGGLLGDGGVSNRRKEVFQHIAISSNNKEYHVWESICKKLGLNYSIMKYKKVDAVYVRFRDYYNSVQLYKKGLFNEYKKRKKTRFKNSGG